MEDYKGVELNGDDCDPNVLFLFNTPANRTIKTKNKCACCLGHNKSWESFILPCGHTAHTRCMLKHLTYKKILHCPVCGYYFSNKMLTCTGCGEMKKCVLCDDCREKYPTDELLCKHVFHD